MTRTPTPWMPGEKRSYRCVGATSDGRDWTRWIIVGEAHVVARIHGRTEEECNDNHDIIVTAVNTHAALRDALRDLLAWVDEEDDNREGTLRELHAHCNECTQGQTPVNFDKGPCVYHKALSALAQCGGE